MPKSGEWLEKLVQEIEGNLLPPGFTITNRKRIYDGSGHQIAEFDLEIVGKLGSSQVKLLFECRDRHNGTAPVSWIEQLVARRDRFMFNQVTAVSTTGFSAAAIEYAREKGIELRTVESISYSDIETWYRAQQFDILYRSVDLRRAHLEVEESITGEEFETVLNLVESSSSADDLALYNPVTHNRIGISDLLHIALKKLPITFEVTESGIEKRSEQIPVFIPEPRLRPYLVVNGKQIRIKKIDFFVETTVRRERISIAQITEYADTQSNQRIVQSVHYVVPFYGKNFDLRIHRYSQDGPSTVNYRLSDADDLYSQ